MPQTRTWLLVVIMTVHVGALRSWSAVFWTSVEPWLRRKLGQRWGIEIVWERTAQGRAWAIRGQQGRRTFGIACTSAIVWMVGMLLPAILVGAATAFGTLQSPLGPLLLVETVALSPTLWLRAIRSAS